MTGKTLSVGYIGLGDIGTPMAQRIVAAGFDLIVWNRTSSKMTPLLDQGAAAARSPADLAQRTDIVCTCVTDAKALETVVFGPEGIASAAGRARLLVDNSTTDPQITREMADRLHRQAGIRWLDVPVSGGPVGARAGTLAAMVGGDAADLEMARPVILSYARQLTHMGPVGAGQATKACNQLINFVGMASVAEALHLAAGFGIDVEKLPQALAGGFADTPILREFARGKAAGEESKGITFLVQALVALYEGQCDPTLRRRFRILMKDMGIVIDMSRASGRAVPVFSQVEALYRIMAGPK